MEVERYKPGNGQPECPGCRRTTGPPGALCPYCGSVYPDPSAGGAAAALWVVAVGGIGLSLLTQSVSGAVAGVLGLIGIGALIGAVGMGARSKGRVGPAVPRQASCCGCSCVVALLVIPSVGALMWAHGGPALATLAVPAWVPLSWVIRGVELLTAALTRNRLAG